MWHGILSGSADETAPDQWFEFRTYLRETIGEILGGEVVSAGWLLKSFTSYAAFLLLLWMGLRWRRRTEWFWILALLPALAWGTLTLRRGLARHGGETSAASAEVFMLPGQDGLKARWTSISAVYSPGNARLNFPLEQHGLLSPAISWSDYHRVFFPLTFDQGSSPAMRGLRILPMSYHSFCLEGAFDSTGSLLLKADDDSTGALRLHNNSGFTFNYWVVLYRDFITSGTAMTAGTDSPSVWYPFRPYDELRSEDRSFADRDYLFGLVNAYCYRAEWKPENPLFIGISGDSRFPGAALPAIPGKGFLAVIQELNAPAHLPRDSAGDWALHWTPHDAYSYDYRSRLPVTIDGRATLDFVHCSPAAFDPARPLVVSLGGVDQAKRDQDNMLYDEAMTMDEGLMDIEASMFDASSGLSFDDPRPHHRPADTMQELEERIATQPVDADWEVYNFGCGAWERLGIGSQFRLCPARDFVTPVEPRMMLRLHIPESSAGGEPITAGEDELMEMESPELNISFELGAYRIHQPPAPDDSSHSAPAEVAQ